MAAHYQSSQHGGSHHLSSHFGRVAIVPPVEEPDDGSAWRPDEPWQRERPDFYREQILEEDEELMALVMAFLQVMDD